MATHGDIRDDDGSPALTPEETHERSELARHLRGSIFPADPSAILACAVEEHAPPRLVEALRRLPAGEYRNVEGVWEALGGRRDERTPEGDVEDPAGAAAPRAVFEELDGPFPEADEADQADEADHADEADDPVPGQVHRFGFRFAGPFRLAALPFLVDPGGAHVTVDAGPAGGLEVRYGPWCVQTPLANVAGAEVTGPYALVKTIGPPHLSLADRGLTFASNRDRGVCIRFHEPVRGIDALGLVRHPGLTVTVDDVDGLVAVLGAAPAGP